MHLMIVVPLVGELLLELVDRAVAALDLLRLRQLVDAHDEDVLVVRAVEDADLARRAAAPSRPATGSRGQLLLVGALNEKIRRPLGSKRPVVCLRTPPLPEVSMPWSTSRMRRSPSV